MNATAAEAPARPVGLGAYSARLGRDQQDATVELEAALLFADVTGYTRLGERLAQSGRVGAETLTNAINVCFTSLVDEVEALGGDVVRFGGDALLIAIVGTDRVTRAALLAARMQAAVAALASIETPGGRVRLRMSMGLHDGAVTVYRWVGRWVEVVPVGPAVTLVLQAEAAASAGEVRVTPIVAARLGNRLTDGRRLRLGPARRLVVDPTPTGTSEPAEASRFVPPMLRDVLASGLTPEHRAIAVGFVGTHGTDQLSATPSRLQAALDAFFNVVDDVTDRFGVVPIGTDVAIDGVKILVVSGVPTATEDDEDRLVTSIRMIVDQVPTARAGIHTGLAYCGDVGHPNRRTFSVIGDSVNLAARLLGRAGPGEVVASTAFVDAIGASFDAVRMEPFTVKGKTAPQHAAVVGHRAPRPTDGAESPFRGRQIEVDRALSSLSTSGVAEVCGERGIGASRLAREVVTSRGATAIAVHATVEDRATPFSVARRVAEAVAIGWPMPHRGWDALPSIDELVSTIAERLQSANRVSRRILVVDGLQHVDEASRFVLRGLASIAPTAGFEMITLGRSATLGADAPIELAPLGADDLRAICIDRAARPLSDEDLATIVIRAAGNPRFAEQLARLPSADADLPISIEAVVTARLDRLPRAVRQLIREVALVGTNASIDLVAAVTGRTAGSIATVLSVAGDIGSIVDGHTFRFDDEAVREVAAAGLPRERSRELHRRLFELRAADADAPAARVALHAGEAGDDEATWRWSARAAHDAQESGTPASAADLAGRAFQAAERLGRPPRELIGLAMLVAESATRAGLDAVADAALVDAIGLESQPTARAALRVRRARLANRQGRQRSARAHLALAARDATGAEAVQVAIELGHLELDRGRTDHALALGEQADSAARRLRRKDLQAQALTLIAWAAEYRGQDDTKALAERSLRLARESGDRVIAGHSANNLAVTLDNDGRWPEALDLYDEAEGHFRAAGDLANRVAAAANRVTILDELGDVDAVASAVDELMRIAGAAGNWGVVGLCEMLLARSRGRQGNPLEAISLAERALVRVRRLAQPETALWNTTRLIELLILSGRHRDALSLIDEHRDHIDHLGSAHMLPITIRRLSAVAMAGLGDDAAARAILIDAAERADRADNLPERCFVRWAIAQLPGGLSDVEMRLVEQLERELAPVSAVWFRTAWPASGGRRPN